MKWYTVEFKIYRYNDNIDNSNTSIKCDDLEKAQSIKNKIDRVYDLGEKAWNMEDDEDVKFVSNLIFENTADGGFIDSHAEIYYLTKNKI